MEIQKEIDQLVSLERKLSQAEIAAAMELLPGAGWHGAQSIALRLRREDKAVVRQEAILMLKFLVDEFPDPSWPSYEYWTLRSLVELAQGPIPSLSAAYVIRHFGRMNENKEMLAEALFLIGTEDAAVALINAALEQPEETRYISRSYAMERAVERGQWTQDFRNLMSGFLAQSVEKHSATTFSKSDAAQLWMLVDAVRATERLTREPFWSVKFEGLWHVLRLLKGNAARVTEERLWRLADELTQVALLHNQSRHRLGDIVWLLAHLRSPKVRPLIEELKSNPETLEMGLASEAAMLGIVNPDKAVHRFLESPGYAQSPNAVRQHWAMWWLRVEISNGGIHQYFSNSSGDLWPDALQGLKEVGLQASTTAFQAALDSFGPQGPAIKRDERNAQLQRMSEATLEEMGRHGERVMDHWSEVSMWPFILRHADIFRTEPPPLPLM